MDSEVADMHHANFGFLPSERVMHLGPLFILLHGSVFFPVDTVKVYVL